MQNNSNSHAESLHNFVEHALSTHHEANTVFNRGWYIWLFFLTMQSHEVLEKRKKNYEILKNRGNNNVF